LTWYSIITGHFNAILQAKKRSEKLVVGIHSDEEILRNKGPPVMKQEERYQMLTHIKWVDEIAYDVPYSPSIEVLDQYHCEKAFHG
jgi:ethanolamine-phosphate cytidylyltransferase